MRVLFIHQNFPGQYKHLAPALAADPENEVVCIGEEGAIARLGPPPARLRFIGYPAPRGAGEGTHHYLRSTEAGVRRGQAVTRKLMDLKAAGWLPDVVLVHPGWGESLFIKDVFPATKLCVYLEFFYRPEGSDVGFDAEFPTSLDDVFKLRMRNTVQLVSMEQADIGLSPTHWQRAQYPAWMRERIRVIHDGIDTAVVAPSADAGFELPDGRTLRPGDEVITYVARNLEPYRGFHSFMRALPAMLDARPGATVVVVGGDEVSYGRSAPDGKTYRELYEPLIAGHPGRHRVHFLGKLPYARYLDLLRVSRVHLYLTYPFVLSWSSMEAMASGCSMVASATPPVQEVMRDGVNARLVDFFDPAGIAKAVVAILDGSDPDAARRARARADAVAQYDLRGACLPQQLALVRDLAAGRL
ncbi:glycosyltransferase family 4 protein [Derxia gummosa]|uniref:Glycosyltransferase family 4 protein n=1 Tax=Derxia gummosa DSM 723 TaxID=1121388 RepID=A0A8B6X5P6_9BURK|nr:glycosyltransferase family 4 protein [Derxia gummosa]